MTYERIFSSDAGVQALLEHGSERPADVTGFVRMHREAAALVRAGAVELVDRARGAVELFGLSLEMPLPRGEVERRIGEHLETLGARALPAAVPLLRLEWPVGYRFASLFERHRRDRATQRAVAEAVLALGPGDVREASELLRVAMVQENLAALGPALALLPRARFDTWMDVLELAFAVGDRRHVAALRALGRGRVPADAREALRDVARDLARR